MKVPGINFSPNYAKGSRLNRARSMARIRSEIYNNVIREYNKPQPENPTKKLEQVSIEQIEKAVKDKLPEPLNFVLNKIDLSKIRAEGVLVTNLEDNIVKSYSMELLTDKNKLPISRVPTLMHETTHLLDKALNPQYRAVEEQLSKKDLIEKVEEFMDSTLYTLKRLSKSEVREKTQEFIKDMPAEDQLLCLKFFKLQMETETRAYGANKLFTEKIDLWNNKEFYFNKDAYERFHFERNIKIIDKLRDEIIKRERNSIKQTINK